MPLTPLHLLLTVPAPPSPESHLSLFDQIPWLGELLSAIGALALIAFFIYYLRPAAKGSSASADFRIIVTDGEVLFKGDFPESHQSLIEDFLLNDCPIEGPYQILGTWTENGLSIQVPSPNAKMLEQRIRNFLKLNLKKTRN